LWSVGSTQQASIRWSYRVRAVVDDLVELKVQVPEVGSDDVPMGLLALKVQCDQVDQDPLPMVGEG
jgi:hypothetical protein